MANTVDRVHNYDFLYKLLLIGDANTGKTSLLTKFVEGTFTGDYISTIGIDFNFKTLVVNKQTIRLQCWDSTGQERFKSLTTTYFKGADGFILTFDLTDRQSYDRLPYWINEVKTHNLHSNNIILVGTKLDLTAKRKSGEVGAAHFRAVSTEEASKFAGLNNMEYLEISSKDNVNVDSVFIHISKTLMRDALQDIKEHKKESEEQSPVPDSQFLSKVKLLPHNFMRCFCFGREDLE